MGVGGVARFVLTVGIAVLAMQLWFGGAGAAAWAVLQHLTATQDAFVKGVFVLAVFWIVLRKVVLMMVYPFRRTTVHTSVTLGPAAAALIGAETEAEREKRASRAVRVARHEAVHAVVADHLGATVSQIRVNVHDGSGHIVAHWPDAVDAQASVDVYMRRMIVTVASHVDELRRGIHDGGAEDDLLKTTSLTYLIQAVGLAPSGYTGELTTEALLAHARERAGSIVAAEQERIGLLRLQLEASAGGANLNGEEVAAALAQKSG
ncbi:hypothetical protein AXK56_22615 [Tsukamurella pulmonis]|nr:hypothetical protein AXK56_22615 [Tsukamurella pulmonis]